MSTVLTHQTLRLEEASRCCCCCSIVVDVDELLFVVAAVGRCLGTFSVKD